MNLLILTSSFPQKETSHEGIFVFDLVKSVHRFGWNPIVLAPHFPGGKTHEHWPPVHITRFVYFYPKKFEKIAYGSGLQYNLKKYPSSLVAFLPFLFAEFIWTIKMIRQKKVNLINTHWFVPQGLIGAIVHLITQLPHVATVHGSDLNNIKQNAILRLICVFIVKNTNIITVNSSYMQHQLESVIPSSHNKIRIIPMGVDSKNYQGFPFRNMKIKHNTEHLILNIGRLIDWKGTKYLVETMTEIVKIYPTATLIIIGSGPERDPLIQCVKELGLENNVSFIGNVSSEDLRSYYKSADVFVLPSININAKTEGLGVVLLEAMSNGCPVIGSDVGGITDIIKDGENGFLVPEKNPDILAKRIIQLLSDDELKERFRNNGYSTIAESFTWDSVAARFSKIYYEAMAHDSN